MPDQWEEAAKQFKAQPRKADAAPSDDDWKVWSLSPGASGSSGTGRFVENFANAINPIPGIKQLAEESADPSIGLSRSLKTHFLDPQVEQLKKAGESFRGEGDAAGMGPIARTVSGVAHGAAGLIPLVGPAAANAGDQIGDGDVAGGLGSAAGLLASQGIPIKYGGFDGNIGIPGLIRATGRGAMRTAEAIAETAMGIRNVDRLHGSTPGRAILDLTTGLTPEKVAQSAGGVISDRVAQRNTVNAASQGRPSLRPALDAQSDAVARAAAGNSDTSHLAPLREQLTEAKPGFAGATQPHPTNPNILRISELQDPANFVQIRNRFGKDFTKFDVARPLSNEARTVGNQMYGELTREYHRAVPESVPLDRDIHNLIPVRDGANVKAIAPSIPAQILQRVGAKTGAMALGAGAGYTAGGFPGMIAGIAVPEVLSHPPVQMAGARALNATGKVAQKPAITIPARVAPLVKAKQ